MAGRFQPDVVLPGDRWSNAAARRMPVSITSL